MRVCGGARNSADFQTANDGNAQKSAELVSAAYSNARTAMKNILISGENRNDSKGIFVGNKKDKTARESVTG